MKLGMLPVLMTLMICGMVLISSCTIAHKNVRLPTPQEYKRPTIRFMVVTDPKSEVCLTQADTKALMGYVLDLESEVKKYRETITILNKE